MISQLHEFCKNTTPNLIGPLMISRKYVQLWQWVQAQTSHLQPDAKVVERIWIILNGAPETCPNGKQYKFKNLKSGFGFCGTPKTCACHKANLMANSVHSTEMYQKINDKRKNTWMTNLGVNNPFNLPVNREKARQGLLNSQRVASANKRKLHDGMHKVMARVESTVTPLFDGNDYQGYHGNNVYDWQCNICGSGVSSHIDCGTVPRCKVCHPLNISKGHRKLCDFLDSVNVKYEINNRSALGSLELDILIPHSNLAIEYNGIYWHSEKHRGKMYHVEKWKACLQAGIRLIQIFSDQYDTNPNLIHSRLKNILGVGGKTHGRNCSIVELTTQQYRDFTNQHHIQGYANAEVKLGLMADHKIQACMSFGSSRYDKLAAWEMIRYCSDGTTVGGASKLFTHFVKTHNPYSVISYADRLWGAGNIYRTLGFSNITPDNDNSGYFWAKESMRLNRMSTMKKTLVSQGYDKLKTQDEIMTARGFVKCHDAGVLKFRWDAKP